MTDIATGLCILFGFMGCAIFFLTWAVFSLAARVRHLEAEVKMLTWQQDGAEVMAHYEPADNDDARGFGGPTYYNTRH